jgi:NAD(P)-dependent dehydrogenase (short-subunit alcohol dehydrogenase family)
MLEGRTALVTGIGPGMGRDIALGLAAQGADVALVARTDRVMPQLVDEIEALGRRAVPLQGSVSEPADCQRVADEVGDAFGGRLDILVNSAYHAGELTRFEDADIDRWQDPLEVNYLGTMRLTQRVLPHLKVAAADTGDARIVFVNTMALHLIAELHGSYAGSKAAQSAAAKTLAVELGPYGIRVNSVHPGYIWGEGVWIYCQWQAEEQTAATGQEVTWEDIYHQRAAETCLKYLPHSSEIAGAVVFLASPLASCVTGISMPVNAGYWLPPSA